MKAKLAQLCFRGIVLFTTGVFFALILSLLQIQRNLPMLKLPITFSVLYSPWWVPAISGMASAIVGLLYPCLDQKLGKHQFYEQEWSNVIRCVGVFIGINHAIAVSFITLVYTEHDFLYIRAWLPCVLFCGGITVGNIGRQLAVDDFIDCETKRHRE
ncbi:insulin-induced gene 2 protein-like isoform X2 [Tachypleus tridentatus]|uniref:insulin-induced gene 2 protein-like isoform X2 n=1 Tax=Tachypleus tridentatus TaxID=6853 RepID=UPI003FCF20A4